MLYRLVDLFSGAIVPLIAVLIIFSFCRKKNWKQKVLIVLFTLYLAEVFDLVGIADLQYARWNPIVNFVPFQDGLSFAAIANVIMFIPFGVLLPITWKSFRKFSFTAIAGVLTSLLIEVDQLFSFRATDIDDLLTNTLGTIIGYLLIACICKKKWKAVDADAIADTKWDILELGIVVALLLLSATFIKFGLGALIYQLPMFD